MSSFGYCLLRPSIARNAFESTGCWANMVSEGRTRRAVSSCLLRFIFDVTHHGSRIAPQRTAFTNASNTYVQYSYDNIGQLKVASSSASNENRGYAHDAGWNLNWLTNSGSTCHFLPDTKNELINA